MSAKWMLPMLIHLWQTQYRIDNGNGIESPATLLWLTGFFLFF